MLHVTPTIRISEDELQEQFVCASGPGGQNVNKVATAVELRFDAKASPSLPNGVRERLARVAGSRMTKDGVLVIRAERFRSQARNRADARERLVSLICRAAARPKVRKKTRPPRASVERRLRSKARHGALKRLRGAPAED